MAVLSLELPTPFRLAVHSPVLAEDFDLIFFSGHETNTSGSVTSVSCAASKLRSYCQCCCTVPLSGVSAGLPRSEKSYVAVWFGDKGAAFQEI